MKAFLLRFGPYEEVRGYLRGLVVAIVAGLFLTFSGAFGTGEAGLAIRLFYWMVMMVVGYAWGARSKSVV